MLIASKYLYKALRYLTFSYQDVQIKKQERDILTEE